MAASKTLPASEGQRPTWHERMAWEAGAYEFAHCEAHQFSVLRDEASQAVRDAAAWLQPPLVPEVGSCF